MLGFHFQVAKFKILHVLLLVLEADYKHVFYNAKL